jgi:Tol biopolymer transport system component
VWSPDGNRIVFGAGSQGLFVKTASGLGAEERLVEGARYPTDWSRDGRFLLLSTRFEGSAAIFVLPLQGERKPFPFVQDQFINSEARFSPDGKWVAYVSNESGTSEIYVRDFPGGPPSEKGPSKGKWLVSNRGGRSPLWRADGRELYYTSGDRLMAVETGVKGDAFVSGTPRELFGGVGRWAFAGVSRDGQRFLLFTPERDTQPRPIKVMLNWESLLKGQ